MKVSRNWLQKYIEGTLPSSEEIGALLTKHSFEIEEIEGDNIDVDILNNRAHDCLSHYGIAREISLITGLKFISPINTRKIEGLPTLNAKIESKDCRRICLVKIDGIDNSIESPGELKNALESIGERSINFVVDVTNYVMYELGQPMHAYDSSKVDGNISVRKAKDGEGITTLDKKEVELNSEISVISDEKSALAIAGVKGGNKAEVTKETTSIILEAANFVGSSVRRSSGITGIRTDSSKRFENEITPRFISGAISRAIELIEKYNPESKIVSYDDLYENKTKAYRVGVSLSEVNRILGTEIKSEEIKDIFDRFGFDYEIVKPREKFEEVINDAIGKPYKYGASVLNDSPGSFDCSSLTSYAAVCSGVRIPRMVVDQYVFGTPVSKDELEVGDLIFSNLAKHKGIVIHRDASYESVEFMPGTKVEEGVDHLGVYVGNGEVIHATEEDDKGVIRENIDKSSRFGDAVVGYRRVINSDEERFVITIPQERIDLRIKEDIIEEIGRIYGYEKIENKPLDISFEAKINPIYYWNSKIKEILINKGFSEVYTYSFQKKGDIEVAKPFAKDKAHLRTDLSKGLKEALDINEYYSDFIGIQDVMIFEIGHVFPEGKEKARCAIAVRKGKGRKKPSAANILKSVIEEIEKESGVSMDVDIKDTDQVVEFDLENIYQSETEDSYPSFYEIGDIIYSIPSQYPFVSRDIAIWVPGSDMEEEIEKLLRENSGDLLVKLNLFDIYTKEERDSRRTSYAFRLVFQSYEKTLSDEEVNPIMDKIYKEIENKEGWEVR